MPLLLIGLVSCLAFPIVAAWAFRIGGFVGLAGIATLTALAIGVANGVVPDSSLAGAQSRGLYWAVSAGLPMVLACAAIVTVGQRGQETAAVVFAGVSFGIAGWVIGAMLVVYLLPTLS